MEQKYIKINELVSEAEKILVVAHKKPDIDTLGSVLAFSNYLDFLGKENAVFCVDNPSKDFYFLPFISKVHSDVSILEDDYDLIVCLDLGDFNMSGLHLDSQIKIKSKKIINIDHHFSNNNFGFLNVIDDKAPSTTVIVYDFFNYFGFKFDSDVSTCLLSGLYSDTGSFKHSNTDSRAYEVAFSLMNSGGIVSDLSKTLFNTKKIKSLKIWAKAFENAFLTENNVLVSVITYKDLIKTGTSPEDLSGVIEYLNMVPGVSYSLLLFENEDGFLKGSLRTKNPKIDLSKIAQSLGGGGHSKASGFLCKGKLNFKTNLTIVPSDMSKKLLSF
ncbi:MAG: bifunctional oligoribonuclease/PAP phosphatase NrnA [Candidatus Gracilibacteria bacterium]|jgi:phosphoesterase RecJ-like protein|nr:bifunctional oligoribonuclease/PAP phosphatase NrnA [Candidatus Gracilibacteria bacterium]